MKTTFFLIRHGETEWNVARREMGCRFDSPLTDLGIRQARQLAARLARRGIDALYSSDLGRAAATAALIEEAAGVPVQLDARLRERAMGIFEGLTFDEIRLRHPEAFHRFLGHEETVPDGESGVERDARFLSFLADAASRHPGQTVAVVTHGGMLAGFFVRAMRLPPGRFRQVRRPHAALNVFSWERGEATLETWGDTAHLDA